jgi:hypothetical protein
MFPRHRFGSSRFNTVVLLLFRLFYHASSFEVAQAAVTQPRLLGAPPVLKAFEVSGESMHDTTNVDARVAEGRLPDLLKTYEKLSTKEWLATLQERHDEFQSWKVHSITWIKALASPFSHEFLQFVVEDSVSGQRTRIAAGREETGDWVLVGWNWASGQTPSDHYELPLPLLSLTFTDPQTRPDMESLAEILAGTTRRQPAYRFRREMCWWYAETVLEDMHAKHGGDIKEWQWSRYRYSFIVKTSFIRRQVLTRHAETFKQQLAEGMDY